MKNEKGFGIVSFLTIMPFLVSILTVIAGAAFVLKADAHLKHECRVSVLKSQHEAAEKLKELMALNPRAESLRAQYEAAQTALEEAEATGLPPAILAAETVLFAVQAQRVFLKFQQQRLILTARFTSARAPFSARAAVMNAIGEESIANSRTFPSVRSGFPRPGLFPLTAEPEDDLIPDYTPAKNFAKMQTVDVDVKVSVADLLPEWLRRFLPMDHLEIDSHCQATIDKKENKWVETLNAVK